MTPNRSFWWLSGAAVALLIAGGIGVWGYSEEDAYVIDAMLAAAVIYASAVWLVLRGEARGVWGRGALVLILGVSAVLRVALLTAEPLSTDVYRYVWDGRVQAHGINPYRYVPADPALEDLQDDDIYPNINRAEYAPTIYPPAAQMIFYVATRFSDSVTAVKSAMVVAEIALMAAVLALLARRGLPLTRVIIYAWHPLPMFEFAGSGHVDVAALAFLLLSCLAAERRHPALAGSLLAAGVAVKFFPAVAAPALYRRWDWRMPAAGLVVLVLVYLPYLSVGTRVFGFLPGYASEEGFGSGNGIFLIDLLRTFVPLPSRATPIYLGLAALLIVMLALRVVWRRLPERVALGAIITLFTLALIAVSPRLPWYFTWLIPFMCFRPSVALLWLTCAAPLIYGVIWQPDYLVIQAAVYVPFAILLLVECVRPSRAARSASVGS